MNTEQRLVTPEIAKEWLDTMEINRPIKKSRVDQLQEDLKRGRFVLSPQPICFDSNGVLIDGQHRLTAIAKSGIAAQLMVAFNVPHDAVIDRGAPRKSGESLYMRGLIPLELSRTEAIALANCYLNEINGMPRYSKITDADRCDFLNEHGENVLLALNISRIGGGAYLCRKAGVQTAIFAALLSGVSQKVLSRLSQCVNTGFIENPSESAAIILRNRLLEIRVVGGTSIHEMLLYSEMAIRDFCAGTNRQKRYLTLKHVYITPNKKTEGKSDD